MLFGVLTREDPATAALFFDMVRRGSGVLLNLPADQRELARNEIASAFSLVFLLVAAISCVSVIMSAATRSHAGYDRAPRPRNERRRALPYTFGSLAAN